MSFENEPSVPEVVNPIAVVALRQGDCSLQSPFDKSPEIQQTIVARALHESTTNDIPLFLPSGVGVDIEADAGTTHVEIKKDKARRRMKDQNKYFKKIAKKILPEDISEDAEQPAPIIVVAHNVSIGAIRRHCDRNGLYPHKIIDCFNPDQ